MRYCLLSYTLCIRGDTTTTNQLYHKILLISFQSRNLGQDEKQIPELELYRKVRTVEEVRGGEGWGVLVDADPLEY